MCQLRRICSQDNKALSVAYVDPEHIAEDCEFTTAYIKMTEGESRLKQKAHKEQRKGARRNGGKKEGRQANDPYIIKL